MFVIRKWGMLLYGILVVVGWYWFVVFVIVNIACVCAVSASSLSLSGDDNGGVLRAVFYRIALWGVDERCRGRAERLFAWGRVAPRCVLNRDRLSATVGRRTYPLCNRCRTNNQPPVNYSQTKQHAYQQSQISQLVLVKVLFVVSTSWSDTRHRHQSIRLCRTWFVAT